jgi:Zn-finger nucleic acid-binding protein
MNCPKCLSDKIGPFNHEGVEFDFCSSCHGIWSDAGELSNYVETKKDLPSGFDLQKDGTLTDLNCPKCPSSKLVEFLYQQGSDVLLDKCPLCQGLWLDSKELGSVQKLAQHIDTKDKIHLALKHVLGRSK